MKILFDVGHPSFVHLFKNCARHFIEQGNEILFAARDKDMTCELLQKYELPFKLMGRVADAVPGKIMGLIKFDIRLNRIVKRFKPDIILSGASPYAAHVASLRNIPHLLFDDTQNKEQLYLYKCCSQMNVTPSSFRYSLGKKHLTYPGFHELAYLHPQWFHSEDKADKSTEKLIVFRFISHNASHDAFIKGLTTSDKIFLVQELLKLGRVIISSEVELPVELQAYIYEGPKEDIHALISQADLLLGESATMASEAAMLGVPSLFFDPKGRCYTNELEEKYGLVFNFGTTTEQVRKGVNKSKELLAQNLLVASQARTKLLTENVDLSSLMIWMVENYTIFAQMDQDAMNKKCKDYINA